MAGSPRLEEITLARTTTVTRFEPELAVEAHVAADVATCGWVGWFNEERLHGELDDTTPAEVEAAHYRHLAQTNAA